MAGGGEGGSGSRNVREELRGMEGSRREGSAPHPGGAGGCTCISGPEEQHGGKLWQTVVSKMARGHLPSHVLFCKVTRLLAIRRWSPFPASLHAGGLVAATTDRTGSRCAPKWNSPETAVLREARATWRWPGAQAIEVRIGRGGETEQGSEPGNVRGRKPSSQRTSAPDTPADSPWLRDGLLSGALTELAVQKSPEQNTMAVLSSSVF